VSAIGLDLIVCEPRGLRAWLVRLAVSIAATVMVASAHELQESRLAVTLVALDFPFAAYLAEVHAKITERWDPVAISGKQPAATFDVDRDGHVEALRIEESSGNPDYDDAVLRAIIEAEPFPPLPVEFTGGVVRVRVSAEWWYSPSKHERSDARGSRAL